MEYDLQTLQFGESNASQENGIHEGCGRNERRDFGLSTSYADSSLEHGILADCHLLFLFAVRFRLGVVALLRLCRLGMRKCE